MSGHGMSCTSSSRRSSDRRAFRNELHIEMRSMMVFVSSLMVAPAGLAFAAARLS
jgi:hypothetical protein